MNTVVVGVSLEAEFIDHILATSAFLLNYQSTAMKLELLTDNLYLLLITCGELFCLDKRHMGLCATVVIATGNRGRTHSVGIDLIQILFLLITSLEINCS
jgi:hypothetical protein